jgi:hypothetical protein
MFGPEYYTHNQFIYIDGEYYCPDCRDEEMMLQANPDESFWIGPHHETDSPIHCTKCGEIDKNSDVTTTLTAVDLEDAMEIEEEDRICHKCGGECEPDNMYRVDEEEDDDHLYHESCAWEWYLIEEE